MRGSGCIVDGDVGGSMLVGPAWGVCIIDGDGGGHPQGRVRGPVSSTQVVVKVGGLSMGWWLRH